ncbi:MAG TPA: metal-binding protein [Thermoplasmataceae archaeon]|nr:metal-binding protein [Thermoplasmataceae archaeon]
MGYLDRISVFEKVEVTPGEISEKRVSGDITVTSTGKTDSYHLIFKYSNPVKIDQNLAGLILTMPVINFTLFCRKLVLNFPVSDSDLEAIRHFISVNNTEVFVNRLCRRRHEFFKAEFLPTENDITEENARGRTEVIASNKKADAYHYETDSSRVAVLSSGGKESLLTYGMLRELGHEPYALFFNESGGHWLTAKTAYSYYSANFPRVHKVWSNVDRFYHHMLSRMNILNPKVAGRRADDYPVQLFIFPVYVFSMIPIILQERIGNVVLGDEFDDPKEMPPFHGIRHYYGIYDQTADFNRYFSKYLRNKGIGTDVWSAVYPISGFMVEKILMERYRNLFSTQRSCHSCHVKDGSIIPCGVCSKCLGIQLFILGGGGDPTRIGYLRIETEKFEEMLRTGRVRLDPDEFEYPNRKLMGEPIPDRLNHVPGIHILPGENEPLSLVPAQFRAGILKIMSQTSSGFYELSSGGWTRIDPDQKNWRIAS